MEDHKPDHNNVYAHNKKGDAKHISEVESGKKGYYCIGCGREMQAKRGSIRFQHFSHDPKDVLRKGKCTYSDETYRHKLAKEILQRIRKIKVPTLYKYPPNGTDGGVFKIKDSQFISAARVRNELQFFEDSDGNIAWGNNIQFDNISGRNLLIQPDVAFFNTEGVPILLIELVATHKIPSDKLVKIRRLGIDTIQVMIPKDSPEAIENAFLNTKDTEWIYNYEQEQTKYIPVPKRSGEGILPLNEFQRNLLRAVESFACRDSQIKNLIRTIGKSLATEQYRNTRESIGSELLRVKENTERSRIRLRDLQENAKGRIEEEFRAEEETIEREEQEVYRAERDLGEKRVDLEGRYTRKRGEIEYEQNELERQGKILGDRISEIGETERRNISEIEREESDIEHHIRRVEGEIEQTEHRIAELSTKYGDDEVRVREEYRTKEIDLDNEFERNARESLDAIEKRDSEGTTPINRRIKEIFDFGRLSINITEKQASVRRARRAREVFNSRAWKNWT